MNFLPLRGFVRAATLAALCCALLPAPALAQASDSASKKKTQKKAATPAPAAKEAPPERSAPPPAQAREEEPAPPPRPRASRVSHSSSPAEQLVGKLEAEGTLGLAIPFESGMNTGFKLNAAGYFGLMPLAPNILLQVGGNVGFTYNGMPSPVDGSFIVFDFLPTARFRFAINEKLWAAADAGAGLAIARSKVTIPFFGSQTSTDAAFLLKLGGAVGYEINDKIALVGAPALNIYLKSGSVTQLTLMVGAAMKL